MKKLISNLIVVFTAAVVFWGCIPTHSQAKGKVPKHALANLEKACDQARRQGCPVEALELTPYAIVQLANSHCDQVRGTAIYTLGEMRETRAVEPLIAMLQDPDQHVRQIAARALGKIGDKRAEEPLIGVLSQTSENVMVRCAAAWALGKVGGPHAYQVLKRTAASSHGRLSAVSWQALNNFQGIRALASQK